MTKKLTAREKYRRKVDRDLYNKIMQAYSKGVDKNIVEDILRELDAFENTPHLIIGEIHEKRIFAKHP